MILQPKPSFIHTMLLSGHETDQVVKFFGAFPHCTPIGCGKDSEGGHQKAMHVSQIPQPMSSAAGTTETDVCLN